MRIQEVATNIISQWEHGGLYTCHGNGALGLIGFQGDNVTSLLNRYVKLGGTLKNKPAWYSNELLKRAQNKAHTAKIIPELDKLAQDPKMQQAQKAESYDYMTRAIKQQLKLFPFKTPLAQLILCDMGVNNGLWNRYVKDSLLAHPKVSEKNLILYAQTVRIHAMKEHGIWDKYTGIRKRYTWYLSLCKKNGKMDMKPFMPTLKANGRNVNIGNQIEVLQ